MQTNDQPTAPNFDRQTIAAFARAAYVEPPEGKARPIGRDVASEARAKLEALDHQRQREDQAERQADNRVAVALAEELRRRIDPALASALLSTRAEAQAAATRLADAQERLASYNAAPPTADGVADWAQRRVALAGAIDAYTHLAQQAQQQAQHADSAYRAAMQAAYAALDQATQQHEAAQLAELEAAAQAAKNSYATALNALAAGKQRVAELTAARARAAGELFS